MLSLLILIALFAQAISIPICGYDRVKIQGQFGTGTCASVTTESECLTTIYTNSGVFNECIWSGSACTTSSTSCKPSCFVGDRVQYTSCPTSNAGACNSAYTGTYGTSNICYYDYNTPGCANTGCDYSCTGIVKTTDCGFKSVDQCASFYYDDGTYYYNCKPIGGACSKGEKCVKICNGIYSTSNCTSLNNNQLSCNAAYELRGSATYDCIYNPGTTICSSKYAQKCHHPAPPSCTGTYGGVGSCTSIYSTRSGCESGFVLDDTLRQCKWNLAAGVCYDDVPCTVP